MRFRKANKKDCKLIFDWANQKEVRLNSIDNRPIKWDDHKKWFQEKLSSKQSQIFIIEEKKPIGQIRIDLSEGFYYIDYFVELSHRGKGYGKKMIGLLKEKNKYPLKALVKESNIISSRVFNSSGFKITESKVIGKNKYIVYEYWKT